MESSRYSNPEVKWDPVAVRVSILDEERRRGNAPSQAEVETRLGAIATLRSSRLPAMRLGEEPVPLEKHPRKTFHGVARHPKAKGSGRVITLPATIVVGKRATAANAASGASTPLSSKVGATTQLDKYSGDVSVHMPSIISQITWKGWLGIAAGIVAVIAILYFTVFRSQGSQP